VHIPFSFSKIAVDKLIKDAISGKVDVFAPILSMRSNESYKNMDDKPLFSTVLMFSGGRDSTIAAFRLADKIPNLLLVTVSTDHLFGIESVEERIRELKPHLSKDSAWMLVSCNSEQFIEYSRYLALSRTCLPCHFLYTLIGIAAAEHVSASELAFAFTFYQSSWPEQTMTAIDALGRVLTARGIQLSLPVYDLKTKQAAIRELEMRSLATSALEQKCLRQITNVVLDESSLAAEIKEWEKALCEVLSQKVVLPLNVIRYAKMSSLNDGGKP
jgi:hypothetical protein